MFPLQLRKRLAASPETSAELYLQRWILLWAWAHGVILGWNPGTVCLHTGPSFGDISHLSQHDLLLLELSVLTASGHFIPSWYSCWTKVPEVSVSRESGALLRDSAPSRKFLVTGAAWPSLFYCVNSFCKQARLRR